MKIRNAALVVPFLGALLFVAPLGCKGAPPPPAKAPAPPPPPAAPAKPVLKGVTVTNGEIEMPGEIEFDSSAATIKDTKASKDVLGAMLKIMQDNPIITRLRVEGHTDNAGVEATNQALSEKRAAAVVKWLVDKGIEAKRLDPAGCGSRDPVVPNTTAENKQKNRRTEFDIVEIEGKPADGVTAACAANPDRKH